MATHNSDSCYYSNVGLITSLCDNVLDSCAGLFFLIPSSMSSTIPFTVTLAAVTQFLRLVFMLALASAMCTLMDSVLQTRVERIPNVTSSDHDADVPRRCTTREANNLFQSDVGTQAGSRRQSER